MKPAGFLDLALKNLTATSRLLIDRRQALAQLLRFGRNVGLVALRRGPKRDELSRQPMEWPVARREYDAFPGLLGGLLASQERQQTRLHDR